MTGRGAQSIAVRREFGVHGELIRLGGGRGETWASSLLVLKPVDDGDEARWVADLAGRVDQNGFRLACPVRGASGDWVVDGWCAWARVPGENSRDRWNELLDAADAFHRTVARETRPEFVDRRTDRWRRADRVAWEELEWKELGAISDMSELIAARRPVLAPSQLVHGDLAENVLFAEGLSPAIIDLSLYWRPVGYAAGIAIADAVGWEGAPPSTIDLLERYADWRQCFLRAVIFRRVVSELARRARPGRADESEHYRPLVELALSVAAG